QLRQCDRKGLDVFAAAGALGVKGGVGAIARPAVRPGGADVVHGPVGLQEPIADANLVVVKGKDFVGGSVDLQHAACVLGVGAGQPTAGAADGAGRLAGLDGVAGIGYGSHRNLQSLGGSQGHGC